MKNGLDRWDLVRVIVAGYRHGRGTLDDAKDAREMRLDLPLTMVAGASSPLSMEKGFGYARALYGTSSKPVSPRHWSTIRALQTRRFRASWHI